MRKSALARNPSMGAGTKTVWIGGRKLGRYVAKGFGPEAVALSGLVGAVCQMAKVLSTDWDRPFDQRKQFNVKGQSDLAMHWARRLSELS